MNEVRNLKRWIERVAVQAVTGILNVADRSTIKIEFHAIDDEVYREGGQGQLHGISLLSGA
jgi:flagellin-like hook-associated protein FlgL